MFFLGWAGLGEGRPKTDFFLHTCLGRAMSWAPSMFFLGWAGLGEVRPKINVAGGAPVSSNVKYS